MPEIKIRLTDEEMEAAHEWSQSVPLAALVKHLLIEAIRPYLTPNRGRSGVDLGQAQNGVDLGSIRGQSDPGTELALSSSQKEKENTEKKRKPREPRLAPLDVSERVLAALNASAGTDFQHTAKGHRTLIQRALDRGLSEADLLTIIRKMCAQWGDSPKMVGCLRPSTLFGPKAEEYLGSAEPRRRAGSTHRPYTIKASAVPKTDVAPGDLFKHAEVDDR